VEKALLKEVEGRSAGQRRAALVVGYGNPLRGDAGAAQLAAARLGERRSDLQVIQAHQLTPELAIDLAAADTSFFVDARAGEPERGVIVREITGEVAADGGASSHHVSPRVLLAIARRLFGHAPRAYLVSLPAYSFDFSETLTPPAAQAADEAVEVILGLIDGPAS
jgi:hydrogenase maturation protease